MVWGAGGQQVCLRRRYGVGAAVSNRGQFATPRAATHEVTGNTSIRDRESDLARAKPEHARRRDLCSGFRDLATDEVEFGARDAEEDDVEEEDDGEGREGEVVESAEADE